MTEPRCLCWKPSDHPQADCPLGREEARDAATADRLIDEVRRALPGVLVVDLTGWAPGEITEVMGSQMLTAEAAERTALLSITYIDKLQHANADDLAFYPLTTLAEALADGHVIACEDNGEPAGYLWFGALSGGRDLIIFQACVDYDSRRRHLGFGMVAELTAIAKAAGCTGIRLKCASSADSNEFWRAAGFYCTPVTAGGIKRGRDINWYRTDLQAGLFTFPPVSPSERPIDLTEYQRLKRAAVKMPSRFSRTHYQMSHPSERSMPVVEVERQPGVGYVVYLPGRVERIALDWEDARAIVARHAPGSSLRLLPARSKEPATK